MELYEPEVFKTSKLCTEENAAAAAKKLALKEKYRRDNTERENARRRDEHYFVGERVFF